jgi:hypothetical protein
VARERRQEVQTCLAEVDTVVDGRIEAVLVGLVERLDVRLRLGASDENEGDAPRRRILLGCILSGYFETWCVNPSAHVKSIGRGYVRMAGSEVMKVTRE